MAMIPMEYSGGGIEDIAVERFGSTSQTVNANSSKTNIQISNISKAGYTPLLAIYAGNSVSSDIFAAAVARPITSGTCSIDVRNVSSSQVTAVFYVYVIFIKQES